MKAYLTSFLQECSYEEADVEVLLAAYDRLQQCPQARLAWEKAIAAYGGTSCDHNAMIALVDEAAMHSGVHEYTADLLLYLCLSKRLRERYRERGIDDGIFVNSMLDLRYKLDECKAVKGIVGSFVPFWFGGFFDMTRFALGRLQFEIIPFEAEYHKDGHRLTTGSYVINVHIPRTGTPLYEEECEAAYAQAKAFFADRFEGEVPIVCYSWLLYPELKTILPETSRMVRFARRYDVFRSGISKDRADLWRLFDTDEQHPDRLPTNTTARKAIAAHLKNGGKLGWGYGVFFL